MHEVTNTTQFAVTHVSSESDELSGSVQNGLLCASAVLVCMLIANPAANMPFMDEFSYMKTALEFARTGHFIYNGWATAMLGWLIPWGALFIKLFGFSFTVVRFSILPVTFATVFLFHQILRRFGINSANAVFGALALGFSPLFLPMGASYMTDVPGVLVIFLCVYMCQRAIASPRDSAALLWLLSAMVINVAGGTVRQIAWLGSLVMVPATAWYLRDRYGMKIAGVLLWVFSFIGVLACLHWFNRQPYSVPEHIFAGTLHPGLLVHLAAQVVKTFLCLLLLIFPVSVAWLSLAPKLTTTSRLRVAGVIIAIALLTVVLSRNGTLENWVMPWLISVLVGQGSLTMWMKIVMSLLVIVPVLMLVEQIVHRNHGVAENRGQQSQWWKSIAWILGPFSLAYVLLLTPRGTFAIIQDRYLLGLLPVAIIVLLALYQDNIRQRLPAISLITLAIFSIYALGGLHDYFAEARAQVRTMRMVRDSGVPRNSIEAGFPDDGWTQIEGGGHVNDPRIQVPAGAYSSNTPNLNVPRECTYWFMTFAPSITPEYFVAFPSAVCFAPTKYPPEHYRAWLPPFDRAIYVQQLKNR